MSTLKTRDDLARTEGEHRDILCETSPYVSTYRESGPGAVGGLWAFPAHAGQGGHEGELHLGVGKRTTVARREQVRLHRAVRLDPVHKVISPNQPAVDALSNGHAAVRRIGHLDQGERLGVD